MKKVVGPMDSTEEYDVHVEEPKKNNKKRRKKKNPDKKKPNKNRKGSKDWSFYAIIVCLIIILIPTVYFGVTLYRAYSETNDPVMGHRFDNDLAPTIEKENVESIQSALETIEGVDKVTVELTTATLRVYLELPADVEKDVFKTKAVEAETLILEELSLEDYFTASDSQLQYDYEIFVHDALGDETTFFLLNKTSRMEEGNSQYLSDPVSKEMVDEIWQTQEELDNPVEEGVDDDEVIEEDNDEE